MSPHPMPVCLAIDPEVFLETQFSSISIDNSDILSILESCEKHEPVDYATESQQSQQYSQFIECYDPTDFYPCAASMFEGVLVPFDRNYLDVLAGPSVPSVPVGSSPIETKVEESKSI